MSAVAITDRLTLRRLELSDAASLMELNSDPEVLRFTGEKQFNSVDDAEALVAELGTRYENHGFGRWAVMRQSDDRFLGWCGLRRIPREGVDLGFRLHRDCWGQGYATEAARACVELAFGEYALPFLLGRAVKENHASIAILKKLRFEPWLKTSGHGFNDVRYSILRSGDLPAANPEQGVIMVHAGLRARALQPADQMDFFMLEGNPNVLLYADGTLASYETAGTQIETLARSASHSEAQLRVFAVSSSQRAFLGTVALVQEGESVEIGYRLLESCWGQGLGLPLAQLALGVARQEYPNRKLVACCDLRNQASIGVLARLDGLRLEDRAGHAHYEWGA
jgi:RimJ/RimL family protein N-acetyltransferase